MGAYKDNTEKEELKIGVPLVDGSMVTIEQLAINKAIKTLGLMTCPSGSCEGAFTQMQEKAQGWIDRAIGGKLN